MRKAIIIFIVLLLSVSAFSQTFQIDTIQYHGPVDALINIVILGDGYKQEELPIFATDARKMSASLFNEKPFSNYREYFNVFIIKVPSNESGAANDPSNLIDNYFGSTFGFAGIDRLLVPTRNNRIVNVLANNFPQYDQVIMLVNSSKYGGSGGWVATASTNRSSAEIAIHELGHSFTGLVDEYWAGPLYAREAINMTRETNRDNLKWKNWYGDFGIGLYPFAESPEWHRPHQNCKMRFLGVPFCSVCTEGTVERINTLASPLLSYFPDNQNTISPEFPVSFKVGLIKPIPNTLQRTWTLNGKIFKIDVDSVFLNRTDLEKGDNLLSVAILDTTQFSRKDNRQSVHLKIVTWSIKNSVTGIETVAGNIHDFHYTLYPNPFAESINIKVEGTFNERLRAEILDINGRLISSHSLSGQGENTLTLKGIQGGLYFIRFYLDEKFIASGKALKAY